MAGISAEICPSIFNNVQANLSTLLSKIAREVAIIDRRKVISAPATDKIHTLLLAIMSFMVIQKSSHDYKD